MKIELDLTKDELTVLTYVVSRADSPYAADPLKDIYECEEDEPEEPYEALGSMAKKLYEAAGKATDEAKLAHDLCIGNHHQRKLGCSIPDCPFYVIRAPDDEG